MQKDNVEGSDENVIEHHSLSDSPYVGGNKMSSSLKDRLKRFRKYSSPISRPSTYEKSFNYYSPAFEYSKEEIENAMNEPEPGIKEDFNENVGPDSNECDEICDEVAVPDANASCNEDFNENVGPDSNECDEISNEVAVPDDNASCNEDFNENVGPDSNECDKICDEVAVLDANASCNVKENINYNDEPGMNVTEGIFAYSIEDVENCVDKESMLEMFHGIQKEYADNREKIRKLKLVQQHHTKNSPDALISLKQKWLTCTQLALRKLYDFMPQPRSMSFETFLMFLQVDFDVIEYNPETDSFA